MRSVVRLKDQRSAPPRYAPLFNISRKTALLFLLLGVIWTSAAVVLHGALIRANGTATDINRYGSLRYLSLSIQRALEGTTGGTDQTNEVKGLINELEQHLVALEVRGTDNPHILELRAVRGAWLVYRDSALRFLDQSAPQANPADALNALSHQANALTSLANLATWRSTHSTETLYKKIHILQLTIGLASGMILVLVWLMMHRWIIRPLNDLIDLTRRFAAGERSVRSTYMADDEIGCLANTFNEMVSATIKHTDTITSNLESIQQQKLELQKFSQAIKHSPASVVITDALGIIEYVNPRFVEVTGYTPEEVIGQRPSLLKSRNTPAETYRQLWSTILSGGVWRGELVNRHKSGELFWENTQISSIRNSAGEITHYVAVKEDVTARKHAEQALMNLNADLERRVVERTQQLYEAAHHDALTGLPNRKLIRQSIFRALTRHERRDGAFALMLIDVDRFKVVNDGLGHEAGDHLLLQIARRIQSCLREDDIVARLGGDEFLVLLDDVHDESVIAVAARKVFAAVEPVMHIGGSSIHVTVSIGVVLAPRDGTSPETLMKNADLAMYAAKSGGRNDFRFFSPEMNIASERRFDMEAALRGALERGEFEVHYQPQIDLAHGGGVCGFEALVRWHRPGVGLVMPADFIPIAEETGLIVPIGKWVLSRACRQARVWRDRFNRDLRIAVNLSARQFFEPSLVEDVAQALAESGLPARNLEIELTESMVMQDPDKVVILLKKLKDLGVGLAVDDFGTGYSSLAYLRHFPLDTLKIDRSFVKGLMTSSDDAALCVSIIAMAHALRLKVVAEGVETRSQLGFLAQRGCDAAQGYLIGKPLPAEDCNKFFQDGEFLQRGVSYADGALEAKRALLLVSEDASADAVLKHMFKNDDYLIFSATNFLKAFDLLATHRVGVCILSARTPGTKAIDFLRRIKEFYPETVRIMLCGADDLTAAIEPVNIGVIDRFFTMAAGSDTLRAAVHDALVHQDLLQQNILLSTRCEETAAHVTALEAQVSMLQRNEGGLAG